ncbi:hypothetical protein C8Q77DRAFT_1114493 [Trametes polyzona]|nr:hypothetical protein C8Q77DRAFT_1114493 [Trametes polyzona]
MTSKRRSTSSWGSAAPALSGLPVSSFGSLLTPPPPKPVVSAFQQPALAVLRSSLTTGNFIDCQFHLYSHRTSDGFVDTPQAVYASSGVLVQTADHFESLILGGFSEGQKGEGGGSAPTMLRSKIAVQEYDYESDSDLEDDGEPPLPPIGEPEPTDAAIDDKNGMHKDASVSTEPLAPRVEGEPPRTLGSMPPGGVSDGTAGDALGSDAGMMDTPRSPDFAVVAEAEFHPIATEVPVRHVIVIPDIAYRTFKAFVYYAYTGEISFTTIRSARRTSGSGSILPDKSTLACSPKSMYRLADKYGMVALKDLAAKNIKSQLSSGMVLHELFSRFTARYREVIQIETTFICGLTVRSTCFTDLQVWTRRIVHGELEHTEEALEELLRKLAGI